MNKLPNFCVLATLGMSVLYLFIDVHSTPLIWQASEPESNALHLISTQLIHISWEHFAWNVAAFLMLAAVIEVRSITRLVTSLFVGMASVAVYVKFFSGLDAYAGLSGALNTLLVVALFQLKKACGYYWAAQITLLLSLLKICVELSIGSALFSSLAWPPVPQAHLVGWVSGLGLALYFDTIDKRNRLINPQKLNLV